MSTRITVMQPGLLTSIQDTGRYGYQRFGVIASGAMDVYALRIANLLVGNCQQEAALEITMLGPQLAFDKDTVIAITGAQLSPHIDGRPVPLWRPVLVQAGSVVSFGACMAGCRAYLAVAGGWQIDVVMGSKSTYLRAGLGGHQGRALQAGDILTCNQGETGNIAVLTYLQRLRTDRGLAAPNWYIDDSYLPSSGEVAVIRAVCGEQYELFTSDSQRRFWDMPFEVSMQSDRMGYRLTGEALKLTAQVDMISEAVALGSIQVPADGNPIVLLADRQTTGGYPKIAQVAAVDIDKVAQLTPGSSIQFQQISLERAEQLYMAREDSIARIAESIALRLSGV